MFWHGSRPSKKRSGQGRRPKSVRTGSFWSLLVLYRNLFDKSIMQPYAPWISCATRRFPNPQVSEGFWLPGITPGSRCRLRRRAHGPRKSPRLWPRGQVRRGGTGLSSDGHDPARIGSSVSRCKPGILRIAQVPLESRTSQRRPDKTQTGRKPAIGPEACLVFGLGRAFRLATRHGLASFFAYLPESRHAGRTG